MDTLFTICTIDPENMQFILTMAGVIIMFLISIVAFFLKSVYDTIKSLKESLTTLDKIVVSILEFKENFKEMDTALHLMINKTLDKHSEAIDKLGQEVAVLNSKIK